MPTRAALATTDFVRDAEDLVCSLRELRRAGCTESELRARLAAGRWQRVGRTVVLHNGALTREQRWRAGVLNCGPRAVLASFSALELFGLRGWERDEIHVLAPAGVPAPGVPGLPIVLHRTAGPIESLGGGRYQRPVGALLLAAAGFRLPRPACGILAAGVQQRLVGADQLATALTRAPRLRHRRVLLAAVRDIGMGAEALSEVDFVRLCRRHNLPPPTLQAVRTEPGGRRRYVDAEWRLPDGRRLVVEVDGALHLAARRWYDDQLRQNEVVLGGALVLRFPSVVLRTEERLVVDQLRRVLLPRS